MIDWLVGLWVFATMAFGIISEISMLLALLIALNNLGHHRAMARRERIGPWGERR